MRYPIRNFISKHLSDPAFLGTLLEDMDIEYHRAAQDETRRPLDRARLLAQAEAIYRFRIHYQTQTDND